ncbi:MAG: esterase/lipase family protein, partial [Planctomycetota bacterium]
MVEARGAPPRLLTLVVHGTFARDEAWWRPGEGSFAARLESALDGRGMPGTVWKPALDAGLAPEDFAWSGGNRHSDRVEGARKLRASLARLAAAGPVVVNFVAHSHGGNVVLEALRRLAPGVRVGRVVLLGTPLVATRPALRLLRLALFAVVVALVVTLAAGTLLAAFGAVEGAAPAMLAITFGAAIFYGWTFVLLAGAGDAAWRLLCAPFLRSFADRPAYG